MFVNRHKLNINPRQCQIYYGDTHSFDYAHLLQSLSAEEINKANSFPIHSDKCRYVITRAILKKLISTYLNVEENRIEFDNNSYGKPFLRDNTSLQFNCSHSSGSMAIGFVLNSDIGVDIEPLDRDINISKLETFLFTPAELEVFHSIDQKFRAEAFLNCWTRKEAILKATGHGLTQPMNELEVTFQKNEKFEIKTGSSCLGNKADWFLDSFTLADNFVGAVAVRGAIESAQYINLNTLEWLFDSNS
jgi:4'-phosphopantetheinyl transferase